MKLVSVQDLKAQAFLAPQAVPTTSVALRMFESECKNKDTMFHKHPADFILFEIGEWDERTGDLTPYSKPTALATASDYVS